MTSGWVGQNHGLIFIFGWTIPLRFLFLEYNFYFIIIIILWYFWTLYMLPPKLIWIQNLKNMLILEKGVFKSCHWSMSGCKIYTFSMAENRKKYLSNKKNCVIVWNSICFGYQSMVRVRTRVTLKSRNSLGGSERQKYRFFVFLLIHT